MDKKTRKKRQMMTLKKFMTMLVAASAVGFVVFAQEAETTISQIVVTNLSDQLNTQVTIDKSTGIDIRRLNLDSIHADKHKSRYTTVKSLSIDSIAPRNILMVKPLLAKDEAGKTYKVSDTYVNTYALKSLDTKNILVDFTKTKSLLVQDLNPSLIFLDGAQLSRIETSQIPISTISISDLGITPASTASLSPYSIDVKRLQANLLAVQALSPTLVNVSDASSVTSVMVIDGSQWNVDTSKFDVEVTEETYAELAEMKLIYNFEQSYNESIKSEVKLNDVKKLERKRYLRWIKILADNKTSGIELVKNTEERKIIGEAWILDGNYNAAVKANMLKNLKFLRSRGYDTVLVRFRCTEDIDQLKQMITDIKDDGFEIFSTFTGLDYETPAWNPFIEPETLQKYISEIAPLCIGYLLNWRSTSNHVKIIPIEYFNYICKLLRMANSKILIYGEVYYGNIDPLRMRTLIYTAPENVTGVLINNMGYYGYNITYVVNNLFATSVPGYRKMDKLGQVIGVAPYYCSRASTKISNLTVEKEYSYKAKVEKAFNRTNHGTVTMLHDGVDDNQTRLIAKPGDAKYSDTTDNILYDTKIFDKIRSPRSSLSTSDRVHMPAKEEATEN